MRLGPNLDLEQLLNDVRWVLCNHAQSVADLVVETGIAKRAKRCGASLFLSLRR